MESLAVFVVGPAGTGKTTFCHKMYEYLQNLEKEVYYINLDPSSSSKISCVFDINDAISTEEVMKECNMGPNGGLVECFRSLVEVLDELDIFNFPASSVVLVDCPGQIELYMHYDYMTKIIEQFQRNSVTCCVAYVIESHYLNDENKFISSCVSCLCTYSLFSLPQINVISKMDMLLSHTEDHDEDDILDYCYDKLEHLLDISRLRDLVLDSESNGPRMYAKLSVRLLDLLEDLGLASFVPFEAVSSSFCEHIYMKICEGTHFGEDDEVSSNASLEDDQGYSFE